MKEEEEEGRDNRSSVHAHGGGRNWQDGKRREMGGRGRSGKKERQKPRELCRVSNRKSCRSVVGIKI